MAFIDLKPYIGKHFRLEKSHIIAITPRKEIKKVDNKDIDVFKVDVMTTAIFGKSDNKGNMQLNNMVMTLSFDSEQQANDFIISVDPFGGDITWTI